MIGWLVSRSIEEINLSLTKKSIESTNKPIYKSSNHSTWKSRVKGFTTEGSRDERDLAESARG